MMAVRACSALRSRSSSTRLLIDFSKESRKLIFPITVRSLHGPPRENEYADAPLYPPIPQFKDKTEANIAKTKNFMAKLGTVEEKQFYLNKPKYYGWYSYLLNMDWIPCDSRPFFQFATQTHVVEDLPEYYKSSNPEIEKILDQIAPNIEKIILNHHLHSQRAYEVENDKVPLREPHATHWTGREYVLKQKQSRTLVKNIHQLLMSHLTPNVEHLQTVSQDNEARNEAFWFRGGIGPDTSMIKKREGTKKMQKKMRDKGWMYNTVDGLRREMTDEEILQPYERALQYLGSNLIQLRADLPLRAHVDRDSDPLVTQTQVPVVSADPRMWGFKTKTRNGTNLPGVWADVENQHGIMFLADRNNRWKHQATHESSSASERDMIISKAILSSWGWLSAQATHLGFSPMTELTYPLVTQGSITDGQTWTWCTYQLNSVDLSTNKPEETRCNNVMWVGASDAVLFDSVQDGKVQGLRPEVLTPLIHMYLNPPRPRDHSLTPYLSSHKTSANFHEPYQRNKMHLNHRHMYANRPRHLEKPEIYLWEKLHMVDHPAIQAHKLGSRRKRWFQMYKIHHWGREHWHPEFMQYEEKTFPYLPKAFRKEDYMKKKGLGRRYNKYLPKLTIPLEDQAAVYKLPNTKYEKPDH